MTREELNIRQDKTENDIKTAWHAVLLFFTILLVSILLAGLLNTLFSDKPVRYYYLSASEGGVVKIGVDIDNVKDDFILLQNVSYQEAVNMVDSLNKTLPKRK